MKILRQKAKEILAKKKLQQLSDKEKLDILHEYWIYEDEEDIRTDIANSEIPELSESIIKLIINTEEPTLPITAELDPLILDYLIFELNYVLNSYIAKKLKEIGLEYKIEGEEEETEACPCCDYYSIGGGWDICPVCFWENGGIGPNGIGLRTARQNFIKYGAMDEKSLPFVDPEGKAKYARKMRHGGR